jgi:hypothetical protein
MMIGNLHLPIKELKFWWALIGMAAGAMSLINLAQHVLNVGLAPIPSLLIEYYRSLVAPLRAFLTWISPLHIPLWYVDLYLLSFILMVPKLRANQEANEALKQIMLQGGLLQQEWVREQFIKDHGPQVLEEPSPLQHFKSFLVVAFIATIGSIPLGGIWLVLSVPVRYVIDTWRSSKRRRLSLEKSDDIAEAFERASNLGSGIRTRVTAETYFRSLLAMLVVAAAFFMWNFSLK